MSAWKLLPLAGLLPAPPVVAQDHHTMPGMIMPAPKPAEPQPQPKAKAKAKPKPRPAPRRAPAQPAAAMPAPPMPGHDHHSAMPGMDMGTAPEAPPPLDAPAAGHAGHDMAGVADQAAPRVGTDLAPGDAAPPPVQPGRPADAFYDKAAMAHAEAMLIGEHGAMVFHRFIANIAEYQTGGGQESYRWDGEFWIGRDIDRFVLKSEGEGGFGDRVEHAEAQALYSRALDPYWNLQIGVRQDFAPHPTRTYAVVGFEGLAPYWIDVDGAVFLSNKGEMLGRVSATYDQRITQRLILQPRAEVNVALQDMPRQRIGSGVSNIELGLRLRYEIRREFGPYIGVSWDRRLGNTADFTRAAGEDVGGARFVAGIRTWF